jgi:Restriction endonuclease
LHANSARIGWSSDDKLDLIHIIQETNADHWHQLDGDQQGAWYCHGFMDRAAVGDLLFYPNVPSAGAFCVARVTGEYAFLSQKEGIDGDFRSSRPCKLLTPHGVNKADPIVPAIIGHKIGLQRRFYQLYVDEDMLEIFLKDIPKAKPLGEAQSKDDRFFQEFAKMVSPIHKELARGWSKHFPVANLSRFLAGILDRHGEKVDLREGRNERGSDLVIELSNDFLDRPIVIGIQVKSYEGPVSADTVRTDLDQLIRGWEDIPLDYGALIASGEWTEEADKVLAEHNQKYPQRRVKKVDGTQLARIVTRLTWMEDG